MNLVENYIFISTLYYFTLRAEERINNNIMIKVTLKLNPPPKKKLVKVNNKYTCNNENTNSQSQKKITRAVLNGKLILQQKKKKKKKKKIRKNSFVKWLQDKNQQKKTTVI